jgi:DNA polymerase III sliding clamp (beta) subunit (PCNA family)
MNDLKEIETIARSVNAKVIARTDVGFIMNAFQLLNCIQDEGVFKVTDDGLSCAVVDSAHIAMMEILLNKDLFRPLTANKDTEFAIDFDAAWDCLKKVYQNDTKQAIHFLSTDALIIVEENIMHLWTDRKHMKWSLPDYVGLSQPNLPSLPDKHFKAIVTASAGELVEAINGTTGISEHSIFSFEGERDLKISAIDDTKELTSSISTVGVERAEQARSIIPSEYLLGPLKCLDKETLVRLRIGNEYPIVCEWPISKESVVGSFEGRTYTARLFIAPRIESSEN